MEVTATAKPRYKNDGSIFYKEGHYLNTTSGSSLLWRSSRSQLWHARNRVRLPLPDGSNTIRLVHLQRGRAICCIEGRIGRQEQFRRDAILDTHARACLRRIGNHRPSPTAECSALSNSCPLGRIDRSICVPVAWRRRRRGAAGERGGCGDIGTLWPQTEHTSQHRRRNVEVWTVEVQPRVVPSDISQRQVLRHFDGNA
jgi:hypothetical protein